MASLKTLEAPLIPVITRITGLQGACVWGEASPSKSPRRSEGCMELDGWLFQGDQRANDQSRSGMARVGSA
jgi:hypothetical protein